MPEMISKTAHEYGGKKLKRGQRFDADQQYVGTLVALGRAEVAPSPGEYQTRDMAAGPPAALQRRDLSAAKRKKRRAPE